MCMRFGSAACTLGSVDASTVAWLSASICQFVFMFEGFTEALLSTTRTRNSLEWEYPVAATGPRGVQPGTRRKGVKCSVMIKATGDVCFRP